MNKNFIGCSNCLNTPRKPGIDEDNIELNIVIDECPIRLRMPQNKLAALIDVEKNYKGVHISSKPLRLHNSY